MKKTLKISIFSIALGAIAGIILNNTYKEKLSNSFLNEEKTYYFIQEGVYSSTSSMQENTKDLLVKTVDSKNDKKTPKNEKKYMKTKVIKFTSKNKTYQMKSFITMLLNSIF